MARNEVSKEAGNAILKMAAGLFNLHVALKQLQETGDAHTALSIIERSNRTPEAVWFKVDATDRETNTFVNTLDELQDNEGYYTGETPGTVDNTDAKKWYVGQQETATFTKLGETLYHPKTSRAGAVAYYMTEHLTNEDEYATREDAQAECDEYNAFHGYDKGDIKYSVVLTVTKEEGA